MQITKDSVVSIHYTLTDNAGTVLDTSVGNAPLVYLHGHGNLIPGMETGLENRVAGEKLNLKIAPENGYGKRMEEFVQKVPMSAFNGQDVKVGMQFEAGSQEQRYVVHVVEVNETEVTVDGNHPLAGVELNFDVEVIAVRSATADEIAHGHVHGEGGHHH
ncbi:MAG: peptidylprolyl isomerase [Bacteroidia bacterium]|nr:peptidylprolyl isomerase [Bacteroidia bacterium]MCC7534423.1 peptidylprolyl isomerase [Bacteroidia bacterium]MCZ2141634.1 peptidylprolyl isomerase [Bacteroidia bacterium]